MSSDDETDSVIEVTFRNLDASTLADFKLLNQAIFPVKYSERFYQDCRAAGHLTQLAFAGSELVGAIACRLEPQADGTSALYIMTLGVYPPYRGQRIGSRLLDRILANAAHDESISAAYLHVHVENEDAIGFYTQRGFLVGETVENYYRRINPPHAVILKKLLNSPTP